MYVDSNLLLVIYLLAASAALISVYALWTLKEIEEHLRKKNSKPKTVWQAPPAQKQQPKSKGHWG